MILEIMSTLNPLLPVEQCISLLFTFLHSYNSVSNSLLMTNLPYCIFLEYSIIPYCVHLLSNSDVDSITLSLLCCEYGLSSIYRANFYAICILLSLQLIQS